MLNLESVDRGVIVAVRAHAGARRSALIGIRAGMLRVAVTEAPEKGKANRAIVALLSRDLGVSKSSIELISGETSSRKKFLIVGADLAQVRDTIAALELDDNQGTAQQ